MHRIIGNDRKLYQKIDLFQLNFRKSSLPFIFRMDARNNNSIFTDFTKDVDGDIL
jgi:hypothetical protein